jgi:uncharacterized repeat protein (TIGR02543 family)
VKKIYSSLFLLALLAAMMFGATMPLNATDYYVTSTGAGDGLGSDWDNAMPLGGTAVITSKAAGDVYKLKQDTYTAAFSSTDGADHPLITITHNNVQVLGGYTGVGDTRAIDAANTIINGQNFSSATGNKAIRGVFVNKANGAVISGITFQNFIHNSMGGGLFLRCNTGASTNPITVEDCIFKGNDCSGLITSTTSASGPAIFISDNSSSADAYVNISRCKFENNSGRTSDGGGVVGMGNNSSNVLMVVNIADCQFLNNKKGGAIAAFKPKANSAITVTNSLFVGNANGTSAGSVITATAGSGSFSLSNCTFVDNYSASVNAINNAITTTIDKCIFDGTTGTGTVTKTNTLDITSTGLTLDYMAYPAGVPAGGTVSIPYTINSGYAAPVTASVNGGTATAASSPYSIAVSANTTLLLAATPPSVTFNANGGDDIKNATVLLDGSGLPYPGASRRAGYIFAGWYEQSNPNPKTDTPVLFPYTPAGTGNITLYAGWISETDYNNSANFTDYQSRVIRNSVFDKATKIKDIAMLGAHDAFSAQISYNTAKAQELSGYQLAQRGVRIFDMRVKKSGSNWVTHHTLTNQNMSVDVQSIIQFAQGNPGEVLVLYMWPKESIDDGSTSNLDDFWTTLEGITYNGNTLSDFMNYSNSTALKDLTYGDVTDDGSKAGIVIFALDDNGSGASHNAYYLGENVVANDFNSNTSVSATKTNIGSKFNFSDTNRLRVSWCQQYNNGLLNLAGYVDAWNIQFATDENLQTWLAKSPVLMFDFINHTDAFSSAFNAATQRYNIGEPNLAVSSITINAANVNITEAISTKAGETNIALATDGSATEVPDAGTREIKITFTLPAGNHDPYVSVNGAKIAPVADYPATGSYYLNIVGVEEDKNINIYSYAANAVPASADTYINNGSGSAAADNSASPTLTVQSSTGNYKRAAVMRFVLTDELKALYSKAELRMVFKQAQASKNDKDNTIVPTSVTAKTTDFSAINWNTYSSVYDATTNRIGATVDYNFGNPSNAIKNLPFTFDISDYVFRSANDFQVALSGTTVGDGSFYFYSLENGNGEYVPQLIFSEPVPTGISAVIADDNAPARYYNLQGIEVSAPVKGNIYIVRQGAKAGKVVYGKQ